MLEDMKKYSCGFCSIKFTSHSGMLRHQNKCKNNEITQLKSQMEQQIKQIEMENKLRILEIKLENSEQNIKFIIKGKDEAIDILKTQSVATNTIATRSVSALSYLATKYKNAPPLKQLEHDDVKKILKCDEEDEITEKILGKYEMGTLDEFIGDIIVGFYKTKNPNDQSI